MLKPKITKLDLPRQLLATSCLLLAVLYPGHNALQTIIIQSGPIKNYQLVLPNLSLYPQNDGTTVPDLTARGVVVQDKASQAILYAKGADLALAPASTTKIMTALVAREAWPDLNTVITVHNQDLAIGQSIKLSPGEQLTLHDMLRGLLIQSGNDAALALADNYVGGYTAFVNAMNDKAKALHLDRTVYKNPSGIDQYGHYTTPRDLATLARVALSDPILAEIMQTESTVIADITGNSIHPLSTTNQLLGIIPGLMGLKTGWTEKSGECLVSYVDRDGHGVVIVVLASRDRFGETEELINWVYDHHRWITPIL